MVVSNLEKTAITTTCLLAVMTLAGGAAAPAQSNGRTVPAAGDPLTFFVATGDSRAGYRSADRELAGWAFQAWARSVPDTLKLQTSSERDALIRLYWAPPDDNTFGEMRTLIVDGRQRAAVFVRADMEALGPDVALRASQDTLWRDTIVYLTCLHELGHALGLSHTTDYRDIMYFFGYGGDIVEYFARYRRQLKSRNDIASLSGLSEADVTRLRALHPLP